MSETIILAGKTVGEPGLAESLIPIWGSGRSAVNHFQQGNYGRGVLFTALAITDVFLVKSLAMGAGRLAVRGGVSLFASKEMESILAKLSTEGIKHAPTTSAAAANEVVVRASAAEFKALGKSFGPGVQIAEVEGWFVKRINPGANWFRREWGAQSLEAQYKGLSKLGSSMTPEFFIRDGMLFTKSVGTATATAKAGTFWRAYFQGSYRMGTFLNDIRPRNMSAAGIIFDPALDPLMKSLFWGTMYGTTVQERIILRSP